MKPFAMMVDECWGDAPGMARGVRYDTANVAGMDAFGFAVKLGTDYFDLNACW